MKARSEIDSGICGFRTTVHANGEDDRQVAFEAESDCQRIQLLTGILNDKGPLVACQEINTSSSSMLMDSVRAPSPWCCAGCAALMGLFKAVQGAAGLAFPKDVHTSFAEV